MTEIQLSLAACMRFTPISDMAGILSTWAYQDYYWSMEKQREKQDRGIETHSTDSLEGGLPDDD